MPVLLRRFRPVQVLVQKLVRPDAVDGVGAVEDFQFSSVANAELIVVPRHILAYSGNRDMALPTILISSRPVEFSKLQSANSNATGA